MATVGGVDLPLDGSLGGGGFGHGESLVEVKHLLDAFRTPTRGTGP
ncbi:MAG: hypothetical protein V3W34_20415 [Phycisphaerae bacterium]